MTTVATILARGNGARLHSDLPEVLHPLLGDPVLLWVLRALPDGITEARVVHDGDERLERALQAWGRAALLPCPVRTWVPGSPIGQLLLRGDAPLLARADLQGLGEEGWLAGPGGLPLALRVGGDRTADPEELLARAPDQLPRRGLLEGARALVLDSRRQQAALEAAARDQVNGAWMDRGVGFRDPGSTWVGPRVVLGHDVYLDAGVILEGDTVLEAGCRVGAGCVVRDASLGSGVQVKPYCVIESARVEGGAIVGPFARLREGTHLGTGAHVGNFVETKKARLGAGAKANHLTYLGDCEVGERTNMGAGCITCNYDGFAKHRTVIGRDVFVGSDCQLVAPVTVGDGAILGAGTTLTEDVEAGALVLARAPLVHRPGAAERLRAKLRAKLGSGKS